MDEWSNGRMKPPRGEEEMVGRGGGRILCIPSSPHLLATYSSPLLATYSSPLLLLRFNLDPGQASQLTVCSQACHGRDENNCSVTWKMENSVKFRWNCSINAVRLLRLFDPRVLYSRLHTWLRRATKIYEELRTTNVSFCSKWTRGWVWYRD